MRRRGLGLHRLALREGPATGQLAGADHFDRGECDDEHRDHDHGGRLRLGQREREEQHCRERGETFLDEAHASTLPRASRAVDTLAG